VTIHLAKYSPWRQTSACRNPKIWKVKLAAPLARQNEIVETVGRMASYLAILISGM
jgi:hypothetical protein